MKKTIVFCIFAMLFFTAGNAQGILNGIGKLKLGSSSRILTEIGYDSKNVIITDKSVFTKNLGDNNSDNYMRRWHHQDLSSKIYSLELKNKGKKVYKLVIDEKDEFGFVDASFHPSVSVFYIPKYEVAPGVVCEQIILKYFNDALYYIEVWNPKKLEEALRQKYGDPEININETEKQYINNYGNTIVKTDINKLSVFSTGDPETHCKSISVIWHDSRGSRMFLDYLILDIPKTTKMIAEYDAQKWQGIKEKKDKEILKELDSL